MVANPCTRPAPGLLDHPLSRVMTVERHEAAHPNPHLCSPSFSAAVQVRQWSCGIWMWVEPRKANASFTALEKHGTPPTFGLSPTPLAPIGWCGDGVVVQSVSHFGVSTAVGRK